jgi:hypothetical protein
MSCALHQLYKRAYDGASQVKAFVVTKQNSSKGGSA